jgi:hypothetical protein
VVSLPNRVCRLPVQSPRTLDVGSAICGPDRVRTTRSAHATPQPQRVPSACATPAHASNGRVRYLRTGPRTNHPQRALNGNLTGPSHPRKVASSASIPPGTMATNDRARLFPTQLPLPAPLSSGSRIGR